MKIEIELSEVETLKEDAARWKKTAAEFKQKLLALDEKELKGRAVELSKWLFNNYMESVFRQLGFDEHWNREALIFSDDLEQGLGQSWWKSEKMKIEISANVSAAFKYAFLSIGVIAKDLEKEKEDTLEWLK